jgi:hypothetical protein
MSDSDHANLVTKLAVNDCEGEGSQEHAAVTPIGSGNGGARGWKLCDPLGDANRFREERFPQPRTRLLVLLRSSK